jgi:hypothetical protein
LISKSLIVGVEGFSCGEHLLPSSPLINFPTCQLFNWLSLFNF